MIRFLFNILIVLLVLNAAGVVFDVTQSVLCDAGTVLASEAAPYCAVEHIGPAPLVWDETQDVAFPFFPKTLTFVVFWILVACLWTRTFGLETRVRDRLRFLHAIGPRGKPFSSFDFLPRFAATRDW